MGRRDRPVRLRRGECDRWHGRRGGARDPALSLRISALLITYQQAAFVGEALASVLAQTRPPDEVVVVDDGSTDGTLEVVRGTDPRVQVIALPHRGILALGETYNAGLAATSGDLVSTIEGDDRWLPTKLEVHERAFADPTVVVAHGTYAVIGARGTILRDRVAPHLQLPIGAYDAFVPHLLASYVMPVTATIRRASLTDAGGFRQLERTPHVDYATYLALAERGRFHYDPAPVAEWRRHAGSGTTRLAGRELDGADLSRDLALAALRRSARPGLPDEGRIRREWDDAHARAVWNMSRLLLRRGRYADARSALAHAAGRSYSAGIQVRLLLAALAARMHFDVERIVQLAGVHSPFEELD